MRIAYTDEGGAAIVPRHRTWTFHLDIDYSKYGLNYLQSTVCINHIIVIGIVRCYSFVQTSLITLSSKYLIMCIAYTDEGGAVIAS